VNNRVKFNTASEINKQRRLKLTGKRPRVRNAHQTITLALEITKVYVGCFSISDI
jgi:hypothetical protein